MRHLSRLLFATAALFIVASASAADLDAKITNLDGTPILDDKGAAMTLTVRGICVNALMQPLSQEEQVKPDSGDEKIRRSALAAHVQNKDDPYKYTAEDIALMKRLVNKNYPSPLVVSQAWRALEDK
jgi:hypothetical protein